MSINIDLKFLPPEVNLFNVGFSSPGGYNSRMPNLRKFAISIIVFPLSPGKLH